MEPQAVKLSDLAVGQYWFCTDILRIVRVEEATTRDIYDREEKRVQTRPGFRVRATHCVKPIPGLVTEMMATTHQRIRASIAKHCEFMESDDREWDEIWLERFVRPVKVNPRGGGALEVSERSPRNVRQLYCHQAVGKLGSRQTDHPGARGQIEAVRVENMPRGVFLDEPDIVDPGIPAKAPEPAEGTPVGYVATATEAQGLDRATATVALAPQRRGGLEASASERRMTIGRARKLAKEAGVDVSGIKGKGALKKILARIEAA